MPNSHRFPSKDSEIHAHFAIVVAYLTLNGKRLGISDATLKQIADLLATWNLQYPLTVNADTKTRTAVVNKDKTRDALKAALTTIYNDLPQSVLTETDRSTLLLAERSNKHAPAPVPESKPTGTIDHSHRLEHHIKFKDAVLKSNAKPEGVHGCEIWNKLSDVAPKDASELSYVGTATASPFLIKYVGTDGGKMVWYWLRWINTRSETGPWSDPISAMIPA
jgi:hypothetical protein